MVSGKVESLQMLYGVANGRILSLSEITEVFIFNDYNTASGMKKAQVTFFSILSHIYINTQLTLIIGFSKKKAHLKFIS